MKDKDIIEIAKEVNELHIEDDAFFSLMIRFAHRILAAAQEGSEPVATLGMDYTGAYRLCNAPNNLPQGTKIYTRPVPIPEGMVLVLKEPTEVMFLSYMGANKAYWFEYDKIEAPVEKWCTGTVKQAFEVSYRSMLAAAQGEK